MRTALIPLVLALVSTLAFAQDREADALRKADAARDDLQTQLDAKPDDADLKAKLDAAEKDVADAVAALKSAVKKAKADGKNVSKYNKLIVQVTGEVNLEDMDAEVALGLVEEWYEKGKTWLKDNGLNILFKAILFLVILWVFRIVGRMLAGIAKRALGSARVKVSDLLRSFFVNIITKTMFVIGLLVALSTVGINVGPLLAGVGVIGFVVGFALQGTLSNFASGVMILMYRPFDVGDVINAAGVTGKVDSMTLVSTTILTPDNQTVVVPNNKIWGDVITNITANDTRRVDMTIGIGYDDDIDKGREVILRVVKAHELVLKDPEPVVELANLGDSSVDFVVRPWSKTSDYWQVKFDLTKAIKQELDKEGLSIPYPQRDIHVITSNAPAVAAIGAPAHEIPKEGQAEGHDED